MHTIIIIQTHGYTVITGTVIHCHAVYNTTTTDYKSKYHYDEKGILIRWHSKGMNYLSTRK